MEQQIEISPEPQAELVPAIPGLNPVESHEDGCSCEHDSSADIKESGSSVENYGNGENGPDPASTDSTGQSEEKNNSVLLPQGEQCSQEQNQQIKEEPMQDTVQGPAPAAQDSQGMTETQSGQSAGSVASGQTPQQPQQDAGQTPQPQQQAPPQAQPQQAMPQAQPQQEMPQAQPQQAMPQAQPQQEMPQAQPQQEMPQAQHQATVDPAAYAAWQQAMWQQQMAAAQAQAMQPGYPYMPPHVAADPGMAQDSSANKHHPKHDAHKYGQIVQMAEKFVNGEADLSDVVNGISLLENQDSQFWRGLLVGGVATLVLTSDQVKNGMAKLFQSGEADE